MSRSSLHLRGPYSSGNTILMAQEESNYRPGEWSEAWLERRARLSPSAPALECGGQVISYAELSRRCDALAECLAEEGAQETDVVALLMPNGVSFVEMIHATWKRGAILLLMNSRLSVREMEFQIHDSGARFLVHASPEMREKATAVASRCEALKVIDGEALVERVDGRVGEASQIHCQVLDRRAATPKTLDLDRPFIILYTSGTSSSPKGVPLSAGNFLASASASAMLLGKEIQDRWLLCMPLFHVGGLSILLRSTLAGGCVVLHPRFDPAEVSRSIDDERITGISLVANMLQRILDARADRSAPSTLRCVLLGGGPAATSLLERAEKAGFPIAPSYGLTEAASQVATRPPGHPADRPDTGLIPLPGTKVKVVDEAGVRVSAGGEGEIWIKGPTIMRGYWTGPDSTILSNCDGWLATGDIGSLAGNGSLRLCDRRSDLIVSGGENVYPAEVESVLLEHPWVTEAGVAGRPDPRFGARPVAWLVPTAGCVEDSTSVIRHCEPRLARYKIPKTIHWVSSLPRTASGKLLRRELVEPGQ